MIEGRDDKWMMRLKEEENREGKKHGSRYDLNKSSRAMNGGNMPQHKGYL